MWSWWLSQAFLGVLDLLPYSELRLNNQLIYHTSTSIDSGSQTMFKTQILPMPPKHRTTLKRCGSAAPDSINCSFNTTSCLNRRQLCPLQTPNPRRWLEWQHDRGWGARRQSGPPAPHHQRTIRCAVGEVVRSPITPGRSPSRQGWNGSEAK